MANVKIVSSLLVGRLSLIVCIVLATFVTIAIQAAPTLTAKTNNERQKWSMSLSRDHYQVLNIVEVREPLIAIWLDEGWLHSKQPLWPTEICPRFILWDDGETFHGISCKEWRGGVYKGVVPISTVELIRELTGQLENLPVLQIGPRAADADVVRIFIRGEHGPLRYSCSEEVLPYGKHYDGKLASFDQRELFIRTWTTIQGICSEAHSSISRTRRVGDFVRRDCANWLMGR